MIHHFSRLVLVLVLVLTAPLGVALSGAGAQTEACPVLHVCVEYDGTAIAIDPAQGPVQAIAVKEETIITSTFSGTTQSKQVTLAVWIASGDTFSYVDDIAVDHAGQFADAALYDVYQLEEAAE